MSNNANPAAATMSVTPTATTLAAPAGVATSTYNVRNLTGPVTDLAGSGNFFMSAPTSQPTPPGGSNVFNGTMNSPDAPFGDNNFNFTRGTQVAAEKLTGQGNDSVRVTLMALPWRSGRAPVPKDDIVFGARSPSQSTYRGNEVIAASIQHVNELINTATARVTGASSYQSYAAFSSESQRELLKSRYSGNTIEDIGRKWRPLGLVMAAATGLGGGMGKADDYFPRVNYSAGAGVVPFSCNVRGVSFMKQRFASNLTKATDQVWALVTEIDSKSAPGLFSATGEYVGARSFAARSHGMVLFSTGDSDLPPVTVDLKWRESDEVVTTATGAKVRPIVDESHTRFTTATVFDPSLGQLPELIIERQSELIKQTYQTVEIDEKTGVPYFKPAEKDPEEIPGIIYDAMEIGYLWQIGVVTEPCPGVDYNTRIQSMFVEKPEIPLASVYYTGHLFS